MQIPGSEMWALAGNEVIPDLGKLQVERPHLILYTSEPAVPNHPGYKGRGRKYDCGVGVGGQEQSDNTA